MAPTNKSRHFAGVSDWRPLTAESLEARLERHRQFRQRLERELLVEIIDEVQELPYRKPKAKLESDDLFAALPNHDFPPVASTPGADQRAHFSKTL